MRKLREYDLCPEIVLCLVLRSRCWPCKDDERWLDRVGAPSQAEAEMLESAASERKHNSRLSCQIIVCDELDGLIVYLPPTQI